MSPKKKRKKLSEKTIINPNIIGSCAAIKLNGFQLGTGRPASCRHTVNFNAPFFPFLNKPTNDLIPLTVGSSLFSLIKIFVVVVVNFQLSSPQRDRSKEADYHFLFSKKLIWLPNCVCITMSSFIVLVNIGFISCSTKL